MRTFEREFYIETRQFTAPSSYLQNQTPFEVPNNWIVKGKTYNHIFYDFETYLEICIYNKYKSQNEYPVFQILKDSTLLFPLVYVEQNDKEYLITFSGFENKYITIINLTEKSYKNYQFIDNHIEDFVEHGFFPVDISVIIIPYTDYIDIKVSGSVGNDTGYRYKYFLIENANMEDLVIPKKIILYDEDYQINHASID